jgi:NAD(P)-dependent dehydrogenase (short-subunit alcohol dehydrogenase family)
VHVVNPFDLSGLVTVVTGAGSGFGARSAVALAAAGAHLVATGRRIDRLNQTVDEIRGAGGTAEAHGLDVRDRSAVTDLFARLYAEHPSLDVLVNNAAVTNEGAALDVTAQDWDAVMGTNLAGTFACTQEFARQEPDRDRTIVNVSSIVATSGVPGLAAYSASKGALEALTRTLGLEFARRRIRVNAVAPGYMATDIPARLLADPAAAEKVLATIPMRRIADPAEVAPAVVFLASSASSYMTGAVVAVDGGFAAR